MPLPMVHLSVAKRVSELGIPVEEKPQFYLGNIAPDGVHKRESYRPEMKLYSHLDARKLENADHVTAFLERCRSNPQWDYFLGYALHVLTDAYWLSTYFDLFYRRYSAEQPWVGQEWKPAYYNDTDQIDLELYRSQPAREEIWRCLEQAQGVSVEDCLSAEEAEWWRVRTLGWYDRKRHFSGPVTYMNTQEVQTFIEDAARFGKTFLEQALG